MHIFEHVGLRSEFVTDPEFLVVLYQDNVEMKIYGLHHATVEELKAHILFRATDLMQCSMVHPNLEHCTARLVTPQGEAWFHYDPENYCYAVSNQNADNKPET